MLYWHSGKDTEDIGRDTPPGSNGGSLLLSNVVHTHNKLTQEDNARGRSGVYSAACDIKGLLNAQ